ncbi:thiamine pyrophosphate-dependent enzyme, partial [Parvimonas micra]
WKEKDPNVAFKKYLVENKIATESELDEMEENVKKVIADAITFAKESPLADEKDACTDNYA